MYMTIEYTYRLSNNLPSHTAKWKLCECIATEKFEFPLRELNSNSHHRNSIRYHWATTPLAWKIVIWASILVWYCIKINHRNHPISQVEQHSCQNFTLKVYFDYIFSLLHSVRRIEALVESLIPYCYNIYAKNVEYRRY